MALIKDYPLSLNFGDANLGMQANGVTSNGALSPSGVPGHLAITGGHMVATLIEGDALTTAGHRSEIYLQPETVPGEYWYSWEFLVPSSWGFLPIMTLMQIHDTPDGGDLDRFPNFALGIENSQLVALVSSGSLPVQNSIVNRLAHKELIFDTWHTACLHVKWETSGIGFREFFVDRDPMMRQFNVGTAYADVIGPYLKLGVYNFFSQAAIGINEAHYRNIKVWSGNDGYQTVMGGVPLPQRQVQVL